MACYYFNDIMRAINIDYGDILLNEKWYENVSICDILCKTFMGPKPLRIRFDKIDKFIKTYDGIRFSIIWSWMTWCNL